MTQIYRRSAKKGFLPANRGDYIGRFIVYNKKRNKLSKNIRIDYIFIKHHNKKEKQLEMQ